MNTIHWGAIFATPSQRDSIRAAAQQAIGSIPAPHSRNDAPKIVVTLGGAGADQAKAALEAAFPKDVVPRDEHAELYHDIPAPMQMMAGEAAAPFVSSVQPTHTVTLVGNAAKLFLTARQKHLRETGAIPALPSEQQMR